MENLYYGDCSVCFSPIYDGDYAYDDGEILICESCLDRHTHFVEAEDPEAFAGFEEADRQWAERELRHG